MIPEIGTEVYIQSYKHDGALHRTWCKGFVVEANSERFTAVTNKAFVIEADGRRWITKEPAVCFFWTNRWYNVLSMMRKGGIFYYCNMASPSLFDGEAIKNIDYDLDVKLYPDHTYQILDENEYELHRREMKYPEDIHRILQYQMKDLLTLMEERKEPFRQEYIDYYYRMYQRMFDER